MKTTQRKLLLALLLLIAVGMGRNAFAASTFTVTNSGSTFTITRSGDTGVAEIVNYRTVSLSAIEGQHFTAASGTLTFTAGQTSKTVTVTESTPGTDAYKYQTATTRTYRFEVLDCDGSVLGYRDRTMTTGTQFTDTYLSQSITGLTYFDRGGDGSILSGTTHYLDVAHSGSAGTWIKVTDGGYKQAVHAVSTAALYNNNSALRTYLNSIGMKMYATVYFTQKEEDDGYQYIQILADNASTYDGDDPNGAVNTPSTSLYKACFILSYSPSGSVMSDPHTQFFPHRWDYEDRAAQYSANSWSWQEFDDDNAHLYEQEFKSATYRAENSGSLVLAPTVSNLNIRFDAAGSGDDDWYFKDLKVRLALVDATAPTVLSNYKVSGGRHQKGNVIYVSVAFSEIVTVSGTPTLATSWGTLNYTAGSGSNVLTFKGEISSDATGTLSVSALSGTVSDLAGNAFSGTVSHSFGTTLDDDYAWTAADFVSLGANTYAIATKTDLRHLALLVNVAKNACTGLTFQQTQDITYDNTYTPIGYHTSNSDEALFRGTYDGQGFTVSGITVSRTGTGDADGYMGLFGYVDYESATDYGTVRNVVLANSTFTGKNNVGGIVGYMSGGIVENCRVESTVTINAGNDNAKYHGGIVGTNRRAYAKIIGCYSAAVVSNNGKSYSRDFGGIVGYNSSGTVKDCLYAGTTVTADNYKGAIVGDDYDNKGVFTNNYYTAINLGGVNSSDQDGARRARTVTLGTGVTLSGAETTYDVSGLTAIGTTALQSGTAIYSGEGQTLTLGYGGSVSDGFIVTYTATAGTVSGNTLTMAASDTEVSAAFAPDYATHWHADDDHDGTEAKPYIITTTTGLNLLATLVNGTVSGYAANDFSGTFFKLGDDITYTSTTDWDNTELSNEANNYTAIGGFVGTTFYPFSGTFDGDGHTVSGIRITKKSREYVGLFGYVGAGGTVKNVTLSNARIFSNKSNVGGIAGNNRGTIMNCHVAADVNILGNGNYHGGIAGGNIGSNGSPGTISGCTSAATLNWSGSYRGGIAGQNYSGTVENCLVTGLSYNNSSQYAGAIVGANNGEIGTPGTLSNNYYRDCSVNGATTGIGVGTGTAGVSNDVTDNDGAVLAETVEKTVTGYGSSDGGWVFIATPMPYVQTAHHVKNLLTSPAENYDLYRLNNTVWENSKNTTAHPGFTLTNGTGYLYANHDDITLTFYGKPRTSSSDTTITLQQGWNLVGNPFATSATLDRSYYVMNDEGSGLVAEMVNASTAIAPCTGVIVQATGTTESVTFTKVTRGKVASGKGRLDIALRQAQGSALDNAIVSFDEGSRLGKFYFMEQDANLCIPQDGEEYAIACGNGQGEMPLNIKARKNGEYTITVSPEGVEMGYLHLIDHMTGADVDLLATPSYTFTARTTDYASRFRLVFSPNASAGSASDEPFAYNNGNEWVVANEGCATMQVIDVMGRMLSSEEIHSAFRIPNSAFSTPGVYVLRLINGNDVKTQKIVVR